MNLIELRKNYLHWEKIYKDSEWFPVVNENGEVLGKAPREICHDGSSFILHPVIHLHVVSSNGKILLQKRKITKKIQPGKWDTSVGGHVSYGETIEDALIRESEEEISVTPVNPVFIFSYVWESKVEKELVNSYKLVYDGEVKMLESEIDELRFMSREDIESNIGKSLFTPNFEYEFEKIKKIIF